MLVGQGYESIPFARSIASLLFLSCMMKKAEGTSILRTRRGQRDQRLAAKFFLQLFSSHRCQCYVFDFHSKTYESDVFRNHSQYWNIISLTLSWVFGTALTRILSSRFHNSPHPEHIVYTELL